MSILKTPEEQKSFLITSAIFVIIALLCMFLGLTYMDPPPENGIAVNFGTSNNGRGEVEPQETQTPTVQSASKPQETQENLATQNDESPITAPKKDVTKTDKTPIKTIETNTNPSKIAQEQVKQTINSAASNMIKGKGKSPSSGEGDGNKDGNKGQLNGSMYGNSYYGNGSGTGSGSGTKWGLKGRSLAGNDKIVQKCNESGRIVIQVTVNKQGVVTAAQYTPNGSNSTSQCLIQPAIATAKTFRWNPAEDAPESQIGFVEINFSVGE
ncbi:MAG TPA: energy transducer TonB [Flavobacterium sp.]|nr:energy transducer TonB [Flavobacterium sp.]